MDFHDRRPSAKATDDDYATPLSRPALIEANDRALMATPAYHTDAKATGIRTLAVQRHRSRNAGSGDFGSIGEYLDHLMG